MVTLCFLKTPSEDIIEVLCNRLAAVLISEID